MAPSILNLFKQIGENVIKEVDKLESRFRKSEKPNEKKWVDSEQAKSKQVFPTTFPGEPAQSTGCPFAAVLKNTQDASLNFTDTLHNHVQQGLTQAGCTSGVCKGSMLDGLKSSSSAPNTLSHGLTNIDEARKFLEEVYESQPDGIKSSRLAAVENSMKTTGTYELTTDELAFGTKLAWRNAPRCIGRIQWSKLEIFDRRNVKSTAEMFNAICEHLEFATNGGQLRSGITVFPAAISGKPQCRIWNSQYIHYAGYRQEDGSVVGDPVNVEFTSLCVKLGWKSSGTEFDILPLLLQWEDNDPEWYDIPSELALQVPLQHNRYPRFTELGLRWYALPAVCNMSFDCGGIMYPACGFNGWYMTTEVMRDLCDTGRYNKLEVIAQSMNLDTLRPPVYWKDVAAVQLNAAILDSFQAAGVTIVDHHTASESFMTHLNSEKKLRGGCPADWVWITPPISGSLTPVFHQEMLNYKLKPAFDYQPQAWLTHAWKSDVYGKKRKYSFKSVVRVVAVCAKLMKDALSQRVPCTVLYASETGQAERFASNLHRLFSQAFNAQVLCMDEYDFSKVSLESLLLVVTSTFGNGEAPENGRMYLEQFKLHYKSKHVKPLLRNKAVPTRFAVFALGSTAYPKFCEFGKAVDHEMAAAGMHQLLSIGLGDAVKSQETSFNSWSQECFQRACKCYDVTIEKRMMGVKHFTQAQLHRASEHRLVKSGEEKSDVRAALGDIHKKPVVEMTVQSVTMLEQKDLSGKESVLVRLNNNVDGLEYKPGDHISVFPCNTKASVQSILNHVILPADLSCDDPVLVEHLTNLTEDDWVKVKRLPICSVKEAITHYLDITSAPSQNFLRHLTATDSQLNDSDENKLKTLVTASAAYEKWLEDQVPSLCTLVNEFPSVRFQPSLLLTQLPLLQPRFYSLSSSPYQYPNEVHITATVLSYTVTSDSGTRNVEGLCSNWLKNLQPGQTVCGYRRECKSFHLPENQHEPIIMIGAGSGIAPFRSFWQHKLGGKRIPTGEMHLLFGCRTKASALHSEEIKEVQRKGVFQSVTLAYSRSVCEKTYVQDVIARNREQFYKLIVNKKAHVYVCGNSNMANDVMNRLSRIVNQAGEILGEKYLQNMKINGRYHEDVFGAVVKRTG